MLNSGTGHFLVPLREFSRFTGLTDFFVNLFAWVKTLTDIKHNPQKNARQRVQ